MASARRSGSTIPVSEPPRELGATLAAGAAASCEASGAAAAETAETGSEMSEFTESGDWTSLLSAVKRSVSVTDFLSFPR
jgi:hypothetical protein